MPLGCDGFVTATPKQRNGQDVPSWVHGSDIDWDLREGDDVVAVEPDPSLFEPLQPDPATPRARSASFLCATVLGVEGCLNGQTIP